MQSAAAAAWCSSFWLSRNQSCTYGSFRAYGALLLPNVDQEMTNMLHFGLALLLTVMTHSLVVPKILSPRSIFARHGTRICLHGNGVSIEVGYAQSESSGIHVSHMIPVGHSQPCYAIMLRKMGAKLPVCPYQSYSATETAKEQPCYVWLAFENCHIRA